MSPPPLLPSDRDRRRGSGLDRPAERSFAEQSALAAAQHLDAVEVPRPDVGRDRNRHAGEGQIVEIIAVVVGAQRGGDAADGDLGDAIALIIDADAGRPCKTLVMSSAPRASIASPRSAVTAIGTSIARSSRLRAVTTISGDGLVRLAPIAAATGSATGRPPTTDAAGAAPRPGQSRAATGSAPPAA